MEWVSVRDRLPEEGVPVLVYDRIDGFRVDYIVKIDKQAEPYIWGHHLISEWDAVTHWQPLPDKPKYPT